MQTSELNEFFDRKLIVKHLGIIGIFLILTAILTFPVIVDFGNEAAGDGCYDKCHMMWRFWWNEFSNENNLDFTHTNYQFYPGGVNVSGNLAQFTTGISSLLLNSFGYTATWNTIWFLGFIFGGYGAYLLSNHFTKNFYSSLIAGIIFTFGSYHMAHANSHIGLSMIVCIPIFILCLFKILNKNSLFYSVLGGTFFFLTSLIHLYYGVLITIFLIIFFVIYVFKEKNVRNSLFIKNFLIMIGIGIICTVILVVPNTFSDTDLHNRSLEEHITYSISLENLVIPTPIHSTEKMSDYYLEKTFFYSFNDSAESPSYSIEHFVFLGYTTIILSLITVIKFRPSYTWFWVLICGVFTIFSFGPELKIFNLSTGVIMPERLLYDSMPGWDDFRAPARFMVITFLGMSMLASFAIHNLMKNHFTGNKKQYILVAAIGIVILFEYSAIPYPAHSEEVPEIYQMIKNDNDTRAILEAPMGGTGDFLLMTDPTILYYQTVHEKPIYGGHESRPSLDVLRETQTYFLNMFQLEGSKNDIIKQNLSIHGISILNYYDIDYVIIHKKLPGIFSDSPQIQKYVDSTFYPQTKQLMDGILDNNTPFYDNSELISYKISKSNSKEPFLLLGSGWYPFNVGTRVTAPNFEIVIINPSNDYITNTLNVEVSSFEKTKNARIMVNEKIITDVLIGSEFQSILLEGITLKPGKNMIVFDSDEYETWVEPTFNTEYKASFIVKTIILEN